MVNRLLRARVTERLTDMVTARLTDMVTARLTDMVNVVTTDMVTERLRCMVNAELRDMVNRVCVCMVTERLTDMVNEVSRFRGVTGSWSRGVMASVCRRIVASSGRGVVAAGRSASATSWRLWGQGAGVGWAGRRLRLCLPRRNAQRHFSPIDSAQRTGAGGASGTNEKPSNHIFTH